MASDSKPRKKIRRRSGNVWGELDDVCRKIHGRLYTAGDEASARRYQDRLERLLGELPKNDLAILRHEAAALLCELKGKLAAPAEHRKREIQLMEQLQRSVQRSIVAGDYDAKAGASVLAGRDANVLAQRRKILRSLEKLFSAEGQKAPKHSGHRNGRVG